MRHPARPMQHAARRAIRLVVLPLVTAVLSAACAASDGDDDDASPHVPFPVPVASYVPPIVPTACQIAWVTSDPPGQNGVIDYYVVDAPLSSWEPGDESYYQGDPSGVTNVSGAWVDDYDVVQREWAQAAVATSGVFQLGGDPIANGAAIAFQDDVAQEYFLLDEADELSVSVGTGGTGAFAGVWSFYEPVAGSGEIALAILGTNATLGTDVAYGLCYEAAAGFAPLSRAARLRQAGDRAAALLGAAR